MSRLDEKTLSLILDEDHGCQVCLRPFREHRSDRTEERPWFVCPDGTRLRFGEVVMGKRAVPA